MSHVESQSATSDHEQQALEEIEGWLHLGHFVQVSTTCEAWLQANADRADSVTGARIAEYLATAIEQRGNFAGALAFHNTALKYYQRHGDLYGECRAHHASATIYRRMGQSNLSFERVAILTKLAEQTGDPLVSFYATRAHAASLTANDKPEDAVSIMRNAFALAEQSGYAPAKALAYSGLQGTLVSVLEIAALGNNLAQHQSTLAEVTRLSHEGIAFCAKEKFLILQCVCLNNLGSAFNTMGRFDEARKIIDEQLALAQKIDSKTQIAWAIANIAGGAYAQKEFIKAKPIFIEALKLSQEIGDVPLITDMLHHLVLLNRAEGEWQQALTYFEEFHKFKMKASHDFANAQMKILHLELDNARASAEAATHEAQVAELAMAAMQLADKAEQDALTGLVNRHGFERLVGGAMARLKVIESRLSMAMIDLDNLKPINDTHSHMAGDAVLKSVAATIREHCRKSDIAVRLGGDEFVIVFDGLTAMEAGRVCERVQTSLRHSSANSEYLTLPTISVGIAETSIAMPLEALLALADGALYRAKAMGKNQIVVAGA